MEADVACRSGQQNGYLVTDGQLRALGAVRVQCDLVGPGRCAAVEDAQQAAGPASRTSSTHWAPIVVPGTTTVPSMVIRAPKFALNTKDSEHQSPHQGLAMT